MKIANKYIVVDDDVINNALCQYIIRQSAGEVEVRSFTQPEIALGYILTHYTHTTPNCPTILFLDLNMPEINGWQFLAHFEKLERRVRAQFKIYILTSSVDYRDKEHAASDKNICGYIVKPLSRAAMLSVLQPHRVAAA